VTEPQEPQPDGQDQGCCFPDAAELGELAARAQTGQRGVPYVGDGTPDTVISCGHGTWRLGDLLVYDDDGGSGDEGRPPCTEPGCDRNAEKGRKYCGTHKSPANRAGGGT
jgi:hypothetical protein